MLSGEAELVSERTGLLGEAKSVKRFERSNELDTALYKNYLHLFNKILVRLSGRNSPLQLVFGLQAWLLRHEGVPPDNRAAYTDRTTG